MRQKQPTRKELVEKARVLEEIVAVLVLRLGGSTHVSRQELPSGRVDVTFEVGPMGADIQVKAPLIEVAEVAN